jgi:hypothetical protein
LGLRDNKLLRSKLQVQAKNKFGAGENQPTPDQQLTRLEDDIRHLRIEFDIFFNGSAKRPPYETKGRVETLLKRLGDDRTLTFAQRYRYNSLIEAKQHCGEPTEDLSFPKFHRLIASKADGIKQQRGCDRVRFSVTVENGHVSFKAKAE